MTEQLPLLVQQTRDCAVSYHQQGLNCAECVYLAFLDAQASTMPRETVALASGFGGGIGQTKHMCGAITGALMALGTKFGRADPFEKEEVRDRAMQLREDVYPRFAALIQEIEAHYGTLLCSDLTAGHEDFHGPARKQSCRAIIAHCAALAAEHAARDERHTP